VDVSSGVGVSVRRCVGVSSGVERVSRDRTRTLVGKVMN
jgi:hypothetical protein